MTDDLGLAWDVDLRSSALDFLADATGDVSVVSDVDAGILWVSPSITRLTGWQPDDLLGRSTIEFVHSDDQDAAMALRHTPGVVSARLRMRHADGSYTWWRVTSRLLVADDGTARGRVSVFHDVDAEVTAQQGLAQSERWFRLLAENLTDFVTMASPDGLLTWASPSATAVLGWTPEEVYGRPTASFLHPDDVPHLVDLRQQMCEGRTSALRARVQRADGDYRWFDLSIRPVYEDGALVGRATGYRDVQAEVEAQDALAASERRFRLLAENAADIVLQMDGATVVWASPSLTPALGWPVSEWIGSSLESFAEAEDVVLIEHLRGVAVHEPVRRRFRLRGRDGTPRWVECLAGPYLDEAGPRGWLASFRVIDDLVRTEQELERRARFDPLTGLVNRHEVFERLSFRDRRSGRCTAVLFCDVDRFKEVNDGRGHAAGDEVLRVVAERVSGVIRLDDVAARIGGDELLVILWGVHDLDEAVQVATGIRHAVAEPIDLPGGAVSVSLSVGVTIAQSGEDADILVARADRAMYEAKRAGRDRIVSLPAPDDESAAAGSDAGR